MKFGVRLPHFHEIARDPAVAPGQIRLVAQQAEQLGFDSIWVGDHVVPTPVVIEQFGTVWYEPLTTLAYAAALTTRVRLGTSVLVTPYRNALLTAKMLSTLDALSGGRVDAGFGIGWLEPEFRALGVETFAERGSVTDDYLATMRAAWRGEELTAPDGEKLLFAPRPVQPGGVPIWIGGNSKRAARRVVELGDAWLQVRPTISEFAENVDYLHRLCDKADRDPTTIALCVSRPMRIADHSMRDEPFLGSPSRIVDQLGRYAELGATHANFDMWYSVPELEGFTIEQMLEGMERFAAEVMPQVRAAAPA